MISQQNPAKPSNSTDPQFKEPKYVCIIGAGFSGLRAAECLMNRGFEVTIVEACSHIGGRLCQSNALSLPVACGAVDSICDSQGRWLDRDRARNPYREGWDVINRAMAKSRTKPGTIHESVTTMDHFRQLLETRRGASDWAEPDETLMLSAAEMWKSLIAEDCHKQSLRHLLLDEGKDGGKSLTDSPCPARRLRTDEYHRVPLPGFDLPEFCQSHHCSCTRKGISQTEHKGQDN